MAPAGEVTQILRAAEHGKPSAVDDLLPLVYDELRRLAHDQMAREPTGLTLQPTALVHEAYLRLLGSEDLSWNSRGHFFAAAAQAMRRILVERARQGETLKRGGSKIRLSLDEGNIVLDDAQAGQVLALDEALDQLTEVDERMARVVLLRHFGGLSVEDTARALDISTRTVKRQWQFAMAWLRKRLAEDD